MAWSIAEVARMSGVTSRTLRHYDEIGLLPPAWIGSNGHRYYEEADLLRLQQILLMRELDLGLREIQAVLDSQLDQVAVLREHHQRLLAERDRLETLARTVGRTIAELEEGRGQGPYDEDQQAGEPVRGIPAPSEAEAEVRERWPQAWEQSRQAVEAMTSEDTERWQREVTAQMIRMAEFMVAGTPVPTLRYRPRWTPTTRASAGSGPRPRTRTRELGQTYVDDPQMRANFDKIADGLAVYQRDAMAVYADARLS